MIFRRRFSWRAERSVSGYTLMELLLVLAIIVVAAAAVAPSLRNVARQTALKSAADSVRAALTRAHVAAMKTGRTQVFQYELNGQKYKIEAWMAGDESLEGSGIEKSQPLVPPTTLAVDLLPGERKLPEGAKFVTGDSTIDTRSQRIEEGLMSMGGSGANWSRPILFFPDGSCLDAFIVVGNEYERGIRIELRGMTGAVKVGNVSDLAQLEEGQPIGR